MYLYTFRIKTHTSKPKREAEGYRTPTGAEQEMLFDLNWPPIPDPCWDNVSLG